MEEKELKSIVEKAQAAVKDVMDENLKKIAFEKILESLLKGDISSQQGRSITQTQLLSRHPENISGKEIPETIQEFFHQKNPESHPDIVLTIAYHSHFKGAGDFNIEDIMDSYDKILVPKSKNPTDIINANIRKGFILKIDRRKDSKQAYHITKDGIDYVNNNFEGKAKVFRAYKRKDKSKDK